MKKNGSTYNRNKGSFGGSLPGKKKIIHGFARYFNVTSTTRNKGTVGTKLSSRIIRKRP